MNDIQSIMSKLNGVELGKLFLKDSIGILSGIKRAYSYSDFEIALCKQDRANSVQFFQYYYFSERISLLVSSYWAVMAGINELLHKLEGFKSVIDITKLFDIFRDLLSCERAINRIGEEPGETEILFRDKTTKLCNELLETKKAIKTIYSDLTDNLILYFSYRDLLEGLSERLELPELGAVLSDDTLSKVEAINAWIDGLDMSYRELFQKVDIAELEKQKADNSQRIDRLFRNYLG